MESIAHGAPEKDVHSTRTLDRIVLVCSALLLCLSVFSFHALPPGRRERPYISLRLQDHVFARSVRDPLSFASLLRIQTTSPNIMRVDDNSSDGDGDDEEEEDDSENLSTLLAGVEHHQENRLEVASRVVSAV